MTWTTFHHRSSYECGECKEGSVHLTLTLTTIFCRCQQTVQLPPVPKPIQFKQTTSPNTAKTVKKCFKGNYITTLYFVLCIVCCVVYCLCVSQYCVVPTVKCKFFQLNLILFHKKQKFILCKLYNVFSSVVGFSMSACSVRLM